MFLFKFFLLRNYFKLVRSRKTFFISRFSFCPTGKIVFPFSFTIPHRELYSHKNHRKYFTSIPSWTNVVEQIRDLARTKWALIAQLVLFQLFQFGKFMKPSCVFLIKHYFIRKYLSGCFQYHNFLLHKYLPSTYRVKDGMYFKRELTSPSVSFSHCLGIFQLFNFWFNFNFFSSVMLLLLFLPQNRCKALNNFIIEKIKKFMKFSFKQSRVIQSIVKAKKSYPAFEFTD